ncbi:MAG TPA: response regulator [Bacteroidetes bacterium]|nr:response regulator [Bacteroidota bacterium]
MEKYRVLVIEDSGEIAYQIRLRLEKENYIVLTASDGDAGLEKAREEHPDLILLDLMLPKLDGYKICRMLKFDRTYEQIPIVILSARTLEQDQELAAEAGADAYLTKPINWKILLETMQRLLKNPVAGSDEQHLYSPDDDVESKVDQQ